MAEETAEKSPDLPGEQVHTHLSTSACRAVTRRWASLTAFVFFVLLLVGSFFFRFHTFEISEDFVTSLSTTDPSIESSPPEASRLNCSYPITANTCKLNDTHVPFHANNQSSNTSCPEYFRWIYEDLRPWASTGISRETLESAKEFATFRLVIVDGKAYIEKYHGSYQTRDLFTVWGIVQLLRLYPGRVPDLELMFQCGDMPEIQKGDYQEPNNATVPPPPPALFQYSGTDSAFSIVFPDWSFWGWVEVNIKPWARTLGGIIRGGERKKWMDRIPYAYWKGNFHVSRNRKDLMKCNPWLFFDWNARLYSQDWGKEIHGGYKHSHLEDQCTHRYKIYIEGRSWSVSDKFILACDSMVLLVKPDYYDFFMRSLVPLQHYWPIRKTNKCRDIKFAVNWGNSHSDQAQAIGKEGSRFIRENLKMEYVYSYMLHLLTEYAKLLKFKPEIPQGAYQVCAESMACPENGIVRNLLEESMVKSPSNTTPCAMPPPYDPDALQNLLERDENIRRQVLKWENGH